MCWPITSRNRGQSAENPQAQKFAREIKFKMAARFYKELDNLSTADFYQMKQKKTGKFYEVDRVISRRKYRRKVRYFESQYFLDFLLKMFSYFGT